MNTGRCLFCNGKEIKYVPEAESDFICSLCVQMFLLADQEDLKQAHAKAIDKGSLRQARAIESFLIGEEYEQRKPTRHHRRIVNRKGTAGAIRDKKRIPGLSQKRKAPSVS